MHHFAYKDGVLHAEDVSLAEIADEIGTPFYCYSNATLERHYRVFADAFAGTDSLICYAMKANSNLAILRTLAALGAGMDVVSAGELERAKAAGVAPSKIVFSGVGKTRIAIASALDAGIFAFNVESEPELVAISEVASAKGLSASVALRINPDVDAKTHAKISTGKREDKFGVPHDRAPELYARAAALPGVRPTGIHMHIGSQITDLAPFAEAYALLGGLATRLRAEGHEIGFVNFGGGLGVPYREAEEVPHPTDYAAMVKAAAAALDCRLVFEPGRLIVGNAGVLVGRVLYVKEGEAKTFIVTDVGMNDLLRPTLYEAYHEIKPVQESRLAGPMIETDVVGPVCETGDYIALGRTLPRAEEGDLLAVMTAGAYGAVLASTYNSRRLVPEVLVKGAAHAMIRPRPSYQDLLSLDRIPDWLTET